MAKIMKSWTGLFIAAVFLFLALCCAVCSPSGRPIGWVGPTLKELLSLAAVISGLIWVSHKAAFESLGLMQKLRLISGLIFVLWGLIKMISGAYPLEIYYDVSVFGSQIIWLGIQIILVVFNCFLILSVLKTLIYVQPGPGTARSFQILLLMLALVTVMAFIPDESADDWEFDKSRLFAGNVFHIAAQSLLMLAAFIAGFRCKWMHYLNRQQKFAVTGLGFALILLLVSLIPNIPGAAMHYSLILSSFMKGILIICIFYSGISMLGLMMQLPSAGLMDRRMRDIKSLQQISAKIGSVFNRHDLLTKSMELAMETLHGDFTWIEIPKGGNYELAAASGIDPEDIMALKSSMETVRNWVIDKDSVLMIHEMNRSRFFKSIRQMPFGNSSLLYSPLKFKHEVIGTMAVGRLNSFGFVEESRGIFRTFCDQLAIALENVRLVEVSIEKEVYKEELRVAHEAQMRLLPQRVPHIPGLDVDGFCLTANDIGGDFYDYIHVNQDRLDVVIGDVSGKGAAAAFYMAELKGVIQSLALHFESPGSMLVHINDFLRKHMESNMFVTMMYLMFDLSAGEVRYARAGHEPLGYYHNEQLVWIEKGGLGLGLTDKVQFSKVLEEGRLKLTPGDGLFLYTDGLIEVRNQHETEFGQDRLYRVLQQNLQGDALSINQRIQDELRSFCGKISRQDDMTAVMIKYNGLHLI